MPKKPKTKWSFVYWAAQAGSHVFVANHKLTYRLPIICPRHRHLWTSPPLCTNYHMHTKCSPCCSSLEVPWYSFVSNSSTSSYYSWPRYTTVSKRLAKLACVATNRNFRCIASWLVNMDAPGNQRKNFGNSHKVPGSWTSSFTPR